MDSHVAGGGYVDSNRLHDGRFAMVLGVLDEVGYGPLAGGPGPDLFPLTAGNDVITDFDPAQDMIDVGDFARPSDGAALLATFEGIRAHSTQSTADGQPALIIDLDGEFGDATTTLVGVTVDDLNEDNVFFGLDGTSIPTLDFTHIAAKRLTLSDGTVAATPLVSFDNYPTLWELVEGNPDSIIEFNAVVIADLAQDDEGFEDEDFEDEDFEDEEEEDDDYHHECDEDEDEEDDEEEEDEEEGDDE